MPTFTSANLLTRFNQLSGRPASNDSMSDADKYQRLSDAQQYVIAQAASRAPDAFYPKAAYGSYPTLTTSDNQVFTFGTDVNGNPLMPIGKVSIYPSLASIPDWAWVEGLDYLNEGTQIRIPNNRTWTSTLWYRGIQPVVDITSTNQPALIPVNFRMLIVYEAVRQLSEEGQRNDALADRMLAKYREMFAEYCLVLKTQFSDGGALGSVSGLKIAEAGGALNSRNWSGL
jgi:hypothetical protein